MYNRTRLTLSQGHDDYRPMTARLRVTWLTSTNQLSVIAEHHGIEREELEMAAKNQQETVALKVVTAGEQCCLSE